MATGKRMGLTGKTGTEKDKDKTVGGGVKTSGLLPALQILPSRPRQEENNEILFKLV